MSKLIQLNFEMDAIVGQGCKIRRGLGLPQLGYFPCKLNYNSGKHAIAALSLAGGLQCDIKAGDKVCRL